MNAADIGALDLLLYGEAFYDAEGNHVPRSAARAPGARITNQLKRRDEMTIHKAIGADLQPFGGYLRCEQCGSRSDLGDVGEHLANGWPKHCGYTMRWWTARQVAAGEDLPAPLAPQESKAETSNE